MPWLSACVRLLEPLEHSTCTCHSKTFCPHKAEALLYWQLKEGIADPALLQAAQPAGAALDLEAARGVCRAVQEALAAQLATGLSRMPPGVCETVERMAALCHTAKLPELERALRALHGEYAAYFSRSATYRDAALLQRLSTAFRLAGALEAADEETALPLAGTFRDDYLPVGGLKLYLLGMREFSGRSGYAGTIYYFWERDARQFYTFTHVRPTFYERDSRRRSSPAVPWGLPCPLHQAWNHSLDLATPRPPGPATCPPPSSVRPPCWTAATQAASTPRNVSAPISPCSWRDTAHPIHRSGTAWPWSAPSGVSPSPMTQSSSGSRCGCWTAQSGTCGWRYTTRRRRPGWWTCWRSWRTA